MKKKKFTYDEGIHNLIGPREIAPIIFHLLKPNSIVDFGCGVGAFLYSFKELGVKDVIGLDSYGGDNALREKYLAKGEFILTDLEKSINLNRKFDLAICLEVAEHLRPEFSDVLVENLTKHSDVILFSASIPYQGGENHFNEQWPDYWQKKFQNRNYIFHDVLREKFWNNDKISYWHKQNMFLVAKEEVLKDINFASGDRKILNCVHPYLYMKKAETVENIVKGKFGLFFYFKLILKCTLRIFRLIKD